MDPDLRLGLNTKLGLILTESEMRRVFLPPRTHTQAFQFLTVRTPALFASRLNFHTFKGFLWQDGIKNCAKKPINELEN